MWQTSYKTAVSLFLVWHFTGVTLWICPPSPLQEQLIQPFIWYVNYFGLWQNWSVFVSPRTINYYLTAFIRFKDGTERTWEFPRPEKLGIVEKMFKERYRQWGTDAVNDDTEPYLRPDAARYIARLHNSDPANPPVGVALIRHWTYIPPPEEGLGKPLPDDDDGQDVIYEAEITPGDLE